MPHFDHQKITVIFVLGGPGAGKGTQCHKLVEGFGFVHLSGLALYLLLAFHCDADPVFAAGDLLRAEQDRKDSQFGDEIRTCIKEGKIVRMEITIELLRKAMIQEIEARVGSENWTDGKGRFLIDGFPRKMDQAVKFEEDVSSAPGHVFVPSDLMLGLRSDPGPLF